MKLSYSIQILLTILVLAACSGDDTPNDDTSDMAFSIITTTPTEVTQIKATIGGTITGATLGDVNEVGVVYGLSANPTTNDMVIKASSETLDFSVQLTDLDVNTQYFARSYVMLQNEIFYGDEIQFSTLDHLIFSGIPRLTSQTQLDAFFSEGWSIIYGVIIEEDEPGNITNLNAMSNIIEIGGGGNFIDALQINNNIALENLDGLQNVKYLGGISISRNNISDLGALANIEEFDSSLRITEEPLTSLQGLHHLTDISGTFQVINTGLESLNDLENLQSIGEDIIIVDNKKLTDFCALTTAAEDFNMFYTVFKNAYNPTLEDLQAGNCSQ